MGQGNKGCKYSWDALKYRRYRANYKIVFNLSYQETLESQGPHWAVIYRTYAKNAVNEIHAGQIKLTKSTIVYDFRHDIKLFSLKMQHTLKDLGSYDAKWPHSQTSETRKWYIKITEIFNNWPRVYDTRYEMELCHESVACAAYTLHVQSTLSKCHWRGRINAFNYL